MSTRVLAFLLALLLSPAGALAGGTLPQLVPDRFLGWRGSYVPGEVLVKFKPAATFASRASALGDRGHALLGEIEATDWVHVRTAPGESVEAALASYAANPDVEWAQPNYVYRAAAPPDDTLFGFLWALDNTGQNVSAAPTQPDGRGLPYGDNPGDGTSDMNVGPAWVHITDCSNVIVAVLDSGINYTHVDLAANMWDGGAANPNHGKNFVVTPAGDDDTLDLAGHGTHVAGTIGAVGNNHSGVTGVCWRVALMAVRVLDASGHGSTATIIPGINWASTHGAQIINMSLGGGGAFDQAYSDAISAARNHDVVVVVAAGNGGDDGLGDDNDAPGQAVWPCNFTHANLLCVAALTQQNKLARFSNYGATSVDVGAPGTNIVSTWPGLNYAVPLDSATDAWTFSGGWNYATLWGEPSLVIPSTFPHGTYSNGDAQAWTAIAMPTSFWHALLQLWGSMSLASDGDYVEIAWARGDQNPFDAIPHGSVQFDYRFNTDFDSFAVDVSDCTGTCSVGFRLVSVGWTSSLGVAIQAVQLATIENPSSYYNTEMGTSMAAPNAAGVAAMLRAYNPAFDYADTIAALKGGGSPAGALAGRTTTGRSVDAMGSLSFVAAPKRVSGAER